MPSAISILIYGRDAQLLESRKLLLERSGARVWQAINLTEIARLDPERDIDLLILCHSLKTEQCDRALAMAQGRWPGVQCLMLTAGSRGYHPGLPGRFVDVNDGPANLLSTVAKLLPNEQAAPHHAT